MARKPPPLQVHKFGGASMADTAAVRRAVTILRRMPGPAAVVVSAMGGVTDQLLRLASAAGSGDAREAAPVAERLLARHRTALLSLVPAGRGRQTVAAELGELFGELVGLAQGLATIRELSPRTSDSIAARGERASARLFAAALTAAGVRARYVDAQSLIPTDGHYGNATPDLKGTDRALRAALRPLLARGIVPVLPGFIGTTSDGQVVTLGRGGSDLTATLLARALGAGRVNLWKDVPGLLTADPRVVNDARIVPQMNVREAAELAYYGAKVLHPRALTPLADRRIPIYVRPFADPAAAGTEVSRRTTLLDYPVKALSAVPGQALVTITGNGMLGAHGVATRAFEALDRAGVAVTLITQGSSEHSISLCVPEAAAEHARRALRATFRSELVNRELDGIEIRGGMATLAVVGLGMAGKPGIAARVFSALAAGGVNILAIAQGSSELNITVVIGQKDVAAAQRRIHADFQLDKIGGGAAAHPTGTDVTLLGFGLIGRTVAGLLAGRRSRTHPIRVVGVIDQSGYIFEPEGLSPRQLKALARVKAGGARLAEIEGGRRARSSDAVAEIGRHALVNPVLVDVTAGDTAPALLQGLDGGMHLVLANKRPLGGSRADAERLQARAVERKRQIRHEATVGAGLPVIDTFHKLVESGDRVHRIDGCLSGTLGFLLSEIGRGRRFSAALREAIHRGYTEPDPRDDLSGADMARKALILGRMMGFRGNWSDVSVESLVPARGRGWPLRRFLAHLEEFDAEWGRRAEAAGRRGGVLRYVARVTRSRVKVGLEVVPSTSLFAGLQGTDNAIAFVTERYHSSPLVVIGPGAGPAVTASGVINDILALS
ncbi:MAG TPA: aspartate kinase [Gemmatimonadales bacterium]|nr:aspartate kinase [Gemmatimonadales bacterium]